MCVSRSRLPAVYAAVSSDTCTLVSSYPLACPPRVVVPAQLFDSNSASNSRQINISRVDECGDDNDDGGAVKKSKSETKRGNRSNASSRATRAKKAHPVRQDPDRSRNVTKNEGPTFMRYVNEMLKLACSPELVRLKAGTKRDVHRLAPRRVSAASSASVSKGASRDQRLTVVQHACTSRLSFLKA